MSGKIKVIHRGPPHSVVETLRIEAQATPEAKELLEKIRNNPSCQSLNIEFQINGDAVEMEIPFLMLD